MQRAIVLSNGLIGDAKIIRGRLSAWQDARVVAADAGSRLAPVLGLRLDLVIGDFDSLGAEERAKLEEQGVPVEVVSPEKDETDLELALLTAADRGAQRIAVLGAVGGRLDMAVSNMLLLAHPRLEGIHIELWEGAQTAWLIRPPGGEISGQAGDTVSLIPLAGDAAGITTHRLAYPLRGGTLHFGAARGISNVMTEATAQVALTAGLLMVVHTPGRA